MLSCAPPFHSDVEGLAFKFQNSHIAMSTKYSRKAKSGAMNENLEVQGDSQHLLS